MHHVKPLLLRYHRRPVGLCRGLIDSWKHGRLRVGANGGRDGLALRPCRRVVPRIRTPRSTGGRADSTGANPIPGLSDVARRQETAHAITFVQARVYSGRRFVV